MLVKLECYRSFFFTYTAGLDRIFWSKNSNNFLRDDFILRDVINLPFPVVSAAESDAKTSGHEDEELAERASFSDMVLSEQNGPFTGPYDVVHRFPQSTAVGDKNIDPLEWWELNAPMFPSVPKVAQDIFSVQATSVASDSTFSIAGKVFSHLRALLAMIQSLAHCFFVPGTAF